MTDTWGEAISIKDGKRPEWLSRTEKFLPHWRDEGSWSTRVDGVQWWKATHSPIDKIKVRADHPYYQTKEPNMTKIDEALVERMVNVIRAHVSPDNQVINGRSQWAEFQDIAASLPKPVDPEKEACRGLMGNGDWKGIWADDLPEWNSPFHPGALALAAFRAGREYQKEQG